MLGINASYCSLKCLFFSKVPSTNLKSASEGEGSLCCQIIWWADLRLHFCPGSLQSWRWKLALAWWHVNANLSSLQEKEKNIMRPMHGPGLYSVFFLFRHLKSLCAKLRWANSWRWGIILGLSNRDDRFSMAKKIWISSMDQFEALQVRL